MPIDIKHFFVNDFSQSSVKQPVTVDDDMINSKKHETNKKESKKSKNSKGNANNDVTKHTQLPGSAPNNVIDVEIKDKLLVHPVGRWFEEVNKRLWMPLYLVDIFKNVLRCVLYSVIFMYIQHFYIL